MELLQEPQAWLSFGVLAVLEVVLGIDNIIFISLLVSGVAKTRRHSALLLGLVLAMLTRIALLFSITWLATLRAPLFRVDGAAVSGRALILFGGGAFLAVKGATEIRQMFKRGSGKRPSRLASNFTLVVLQIGLIDIVFSLDSVFTAVGLANRIEIMIAAIVFAILVMMLVASAVSEFINRYPSIKVLALAILVVIGALLIGEALELELPRGYLYFAMAFAAVVEWLNIQLRKHGRRDGHTERAATEPEGSRPA